ncbi:MAG TPA: choice-of-anchor Q domain-containing protein [Actinomycetota bacterium]|nr:choice-of-anchor Q domain-containing protein [Actinomycetota bacterium]
MNAQRSNRRRFVPAVAALLFVLLAHAPVASAASTTVNCASANLQTRIDAASAGAILIVKGVCIGTFTVNRSITLSGTGTLDGDDGGPTLTINGSHVVHLIGITITGGLAPQGAGIDREGGGTLTLQGVTVTRNLATGSGAHGGGIYSDAGSLTITKSKIVENRAFASDTAGVESIGGGILSNGPLVVTASTISSNRATGISFGGIASGRGGGIFEGGGTVSITDSHVDRNRAVARGVQGALSTGGALSMQGSTLTIDHSSLSGNLITADNVVPSANATADGGAVSAFVDTATVTGSTFQGDQAHATSNGGVARVAGGGVEVEMTNHAAITSSTFTGSVAIADGDTADAFGSAVFTDQPKPLHVTGSKFVGGSLAAHSGSSSAAATGGAIVQDGPLTLVKSTVDGNHVTVSSDGNFALASGGGITAEGALTVTGSTVSRNTLTSTTQGSQANAFGGGLFASATNEDGSITNSTITGNTVTATSPAGSGGSIATGGGLETALQTLAVTSSTIARNAVKGSGHTTTFRGGGIGVSGGSVTVEQSILSLDTAAGGGAPECAGTLGSKGFNLVGSTSGCTFGAKPSDKVGANPKLGTLGNHGGPTATLPLQPGSPAINQIPAASCAVDVDQRGVSRPQGPKCDVGAFEAGP